MWSSCSLFSLYGPITSWRHNTFDIFCCIWHIFWYFITSWVFLQIYQGASSNWKEDSWFYSWYGNYTRDKFCWIFWFYLGRVCRDIFSMVDYAIISEYACRKIHSYDAPPSSNYDHQRASPHDPCLQHFDVLMHDLGIHNIFTKSISKKLFLQLTQVKKRTCWRHFLSFPYPFFRGGFVPWGFPHYLGYMD